MHCVLQYKFFGPHAGILYGRYDLLNISVTERLGLEQSGGMLRVGPVQTNMLEEALRGL